MANDGFTTVRVPVEVKNQAEQLKKRLEQRPNLKWLGTVALGAAIGYTISRALEEDEEDE